MVSKNVMRVMAAEDGGGGSGRRMRGEDGQPRVEAEDGGRRGISEIGNGKRRMASGKMRTQDTGCEGEGGSGG